MNTRILAILLITIVLLTAVPEALANRNIFNNFTAYYGVSGTKLNSCKTCMASTSPPASLNQFGTELRSNSAFNRNSPVQALKNIESMDSDKDTFINIDEIRNFTFPGDKNDFPVTLTPIRTTGTIAISSTPSGASIYFDGVYKGTTPKLLTDVTQGPHDVKLTLSGYNDWSYKTLASEGGTSYLKAELTTATIETATATVNVNPIITLTTDKDIYIKGEKINFTITNKGTQYIDAHLLAQNTETGYTILIWPNLPPGCRNPGSNGPSCVPPAPLVLSPGESRYFSWKQDDWDLNGQQIPFGIYIGKINWSYQNSNIQYINFYQNFTIVEPATFTPPPTPTSTETSEILNPELLFQENWMPIGIAIIVMMIIIYSIINALRKHKSKASVITNEIQNPVAAPVEEPDRKSQAVLIEKPKENNVEKPKEAGAISVKSAYEYREAKIYYKIKIENNAIEPVGDIKVHLFVPGVFLLAEKEKAISMLETHESKTVTFEIRPTGECGDCNVSGKIEYYDYAAKGRKMLDIENKSLSVICPVLKRKEIDLQKWEKVTDELIKAEENIKELSAPAENLFNITSRVIKDNGMFMLKPEITSTPQLFNGLAMFYAEGVTGYRYAAYMEVVGGASKSRMILKVWAEKDEALIGFYHRILDDIKKRIDVKIFIDDAVVQHHIHIGDKIGTQVKDSVVQRSNIGASARKCPNCGTEVENNEKFCNECGAKL